MARQGVASIYVLLVTEPIANHGRVMDTATTRNREDLISAQLDPLRNILADRKCTINHPSRKSLGSITCSRSIESNREVPSGLVYMSEELRIQNSCKL